MDADVEILKAAKPPVEPLRPSALQARRDELLARIAAEGPTVPRRHRVRPRKRWVVPVAALATLTGATAAGWALVGRNPAQTTSLSCGSQVVINATSSDPVADCAAAWRQATGEEPPPLVAYRDDRGGVSVLPGGDPVPAGWLRFDPTFRQDGRLIELRAALEDVGEGLSSDCLDFERGRAIVEGQFGRLGLQGWTTAAEHGIADGRETCATAVLQPELSRVLVVARVPAVTSAEQLGPARAMARRLQARLREACLPLDRAAVIAGEEVGTLGTGAGPPGGHVIATIPTPGSACTIATVNAGGRVRITLRGPATADG